jgi:hypothetical protein
MGRFLKNGMEFCVLCVFPSHLHFCFHEVFEKRRPRVVQKLDKHESADTNKDSRLGFYYVIVRNGDCDV